jgi:hypothetical protein
MQGFSPMDESIGGVVHMHDQSMLSRGGDKSFNSNASEFMDPEKKRPAIIGTNVINPEKKYPIIGSVRRDQVLPVSTQIESQKVLIGPLSKSESP